MESMPVGESQQPLSIKALFFSALQLLKKQPFVVLPYAAFMIMSPVVNFVLTGHPFPIAGAYARQPAAMPNLSLNFALIILSMFTGYCVMTYFQVVITRGLALSYLHLQIDWKKIVVVSFQMLPKIVGRILYLGISRFFIWTFVRMLIFMIIMACTLIISTVGWFAYSHNHSSNALLAAHPEFAIGTQQTAVTGPTGLSFMLPIVLAEIVAAVLLFSRLMGVLNLIAPTIMLAQIRSKEASQVFKERIADNNAKKWQTQVGYLLFAMMIAPMIIIFLFQFSANPTDLALRMFLAGIPMIFSMGIMFSLIVVYYYDYRTRFEGLTHEQAVAECAAFSAG